MCHLHIQFHSFINSPGAKNGIFCENLTNSITADALAPNITSSLAVIISCDPLGENYVLILSLNIQLPGPNECQM